MIKNNDLLQEVPRWYAVSVYARQEKAANDALCDGGFETFFPTIAHRRKWSDRVQTIDISLFPGYLFIKTSISPKVRTRIIKPKQVFDIVGKRRNFTNNEDMAMAIPEKEINSIKILLKDSRKLDPVNKLVKGIKVYVAQGPLKGAVGIIDKEVLGEEKKLIVQVPLLGRGVKIKLSANDILSRSELKDKFYDLENKFK